MGKVITTEEFIKRAKEKHGNKYDYSKTEFISNKTPTTIICLEHGEFQMEPRNHLRSKSGCPKCKPNVRLTNKDFINKARKIHGDKYDYSKVDYKNKNSKLNIICPIHGEFEQVARNHIMDDCGCPKCGDDNVSKARSLTLVEFVKKGEEVHDNKYDYSKVVYKKNTIKVTVICPIHGEFKQRPIVHLRGCGCPKCKESKGERTIREFLIENDINFEPQYKFNDCRNILPLPFDFYLPDLNMCVEYNGAQHYKPVKYWGGEKTLKEIKKRDNIKKQYCIDNNIKLMIIRYNEKIENKLYKINNSH